jgi:hypothetical protein
MYDPTTIVLRANLNGAAITPMIFKQEIGELPRALLVLIDARPDNLDAVAGLGGAWAPMGCEVAVRCWDRRTFAVLTRLFAEDRAVTVELFRSASKRGPTTPAEQPQSYSKLG